MLKASVSSVATMPWEPSPFVTMVPVLNELKAFSIVELGTSAYMPKASFPLIVIVLKFRQSKSTASLATKPCTPSPDLLILLELSVANAAPPWMVNIKATIKQRMKPFVPDRLLIPPASSLVVPPAAAFWPDRCSTSSDTSLSIKEKPRAQTHVLFKKEKLPKETSLARENEKRRRRKGLRERSFPLGGPAAPAPERL